MKNKSFLDVEIIMDSIYGLVKISPFEKQLIGTPEFQRLRRIKQLGFVNLVYPTAEHSRFVHSIGVCHWAKKIVDQINENIEHNKRYQVWRKEGLNERKRKEEEYKDITDLKITHAERIIISAAALLHDLPHSPFSHEIESPNNKHGIPKHDDFDKNPVLFKYLFDPEHSVLAQIILIHNPCFWEFFNNETVNIKWIKSIKDEKGINVDYWRDSVNEQGMMKVYQEIKDKQDFNPKEFNSKNSIIGNLELDKKYHFLPILGVMIFETLIHEKPYQWLNREKSNRFEKITCMENREIKTDWDSNEKRNLFMRPLYGWFRPYRHDIIANTMCADLMDYIKRDGLHTGIILPLDLKFLDRMTIMRAPLFSDDEAIKVDIMFEDVPETCEHVVFDVYDHKRGFIRDAVITEILACLHARYQLAERVYEHRVVEGARSMLQEISRFLCGVDVLNVKLLHTNNFFKKEKNPNPPIGDETFLSWVIGLKQNLKNIKKYNIKEKINESFKLAECIKNRRIYREAVIFDGLHGYNEKSFAGPKKTCQSLSDFLVSEEDDKIKIIEDWKKKMSDKLRNKYNGEDQIPESLVTIGVRKWGKRFKVPLVLVAKPYKKDSHWRKQRLDIQPLFACENPEHIKIQLEAMKQAYDGLWKAYLFIHPVFHSQEYAEVHKEIADDFKKLVKNNTSIEWNNSINIENLLPEEPLDIVEYMDDIKRFKGLQKFYEEFIIQGFKKAKPDVSVEKYRTAGSEEIEKFIDIFKPNKMEMHYLKYKKNQEQILKKILQNNDDNINKTLRLAATGEEGIINLLIKFLHFQIPEEIHRKDRRFDTGVQLKIIS